MLVALATPEQPAPIVLQIIKGYAAPVQVAYARQCEVVRLGQIYLSRPGHHLIVGSDGVLTLDKGNPFDTGKPSLDRLFAAAAAVYGSRVIGIVLSRAPRTVRWAFATSTLRQGGGDPGAGAPADRQDARLSVPARRRGRGRAGSICDP